MGNLLKDSKKNTFKNEIISVSRIKRYEQCPLSFKLNYIDKKPRCSSEALNLGSFLHSVLEVLLTWVKQEEYQGYIPIDILKDTYQQEWSRSNVCGIELFNEGLQMLKEYLQEKEFNCYDIVSVEQEFNIKVNDEYILNGKIDLCEKVNDDTIRIIDYKSNRQLYTITEIDSDLQLSVYAQVVKEIWSWAKNIELEFHMIRHNKIQKPSKPRTDEECLNAIRYMIAVAKRTEDPNTKFPANLNSFCSYCDQCDNCDQYNDIVSGNVNIYKAKTFPMDGDLIKLSDYRENISSVAGILYKRKKELDDLFKAKLEHEQDVYVGNLIYYVSNPEGIQYKHKELLDVLEKFGADKTKAIEEITDISNSKLKLYVDKLREGLSVSDRAMLMGALAVVANKTVETPRLNVRKNKLNMKLDEGKMHFKKTSRPSRKMV